MSVSSSGRDISVHLDQLRKADTDIKKWINSALAGRLSRGHQTDVLSAVKFEAKNESAEGALSTALNEVQLRSQEVMAYLEGEIAQTITRIPRASLQLSRMLTDAEEVREEVECIEAMAALSTSNSASYLTKLNELKRHEMKLQRCASILAEAKTVGAKIRDFDRLSALCAEKTNRSALAEVVQLAETLFYVKNGLNEIRKVERDFGQHFTHQLNTYEQQIQDHLQEQCLSEFISHREAFGAVLFKSLHHIDRSDALIQRYNSHVSRNIVSQCSVQAGMERFDALADHFLQTFSKLINTEIAFWIRLSGHLEEMLGEDRVADFVTQEFNQLVNEIVPELKKTTLKIAERASDCEEFISFKNKVSAILVAFPDEENSSHLSIVQTIESLVRKSLLDALSDEGVITLFCTKLSELFTIRFSVRSLASINADSISALFSALSAVLIESSGRVMSFFPAKTGPKIAAIWNHSSSEVVAELEVSEINEDYALLESLALFIKLVRHAIVKCKGDVADYLSTTYPDDHAAVPLEDLLDKELWDKLIRQVDDYIASCHGKVKELLINPLLFKTKDYTKMSVWSLSTTSSAPSYDRGHAFATKPVRDLCEAITEIPVSLDSICGKGIAVTSNKEWMEEIFENFSDGWLDDVICAVVEDFLNKKVLGLHLVAPSNKSLDESTWGEVWEQLRADVSYVHNVVSAVRDKDIPLLEHVYQRLQQMSPPLLRSFVVRDVIYK